MSEWQPIDTAPHNVVVLLYSPYRDVTNPERIEIGCASFGSRCYVSSTISHHSWATHWMPLPAPPKTES